MQVVFRSSHDTGSPAVKYGLSPSSLSNTALAYTYTYSQSDLCDASGAGPNAGWVDPGFFHQAVMSNLPTDGKSKVYYSIGDDTTGWSSVNSFTATQGVDPNAEVKFVMIADMGVSRPDNTSEHWEEQDAQLTMQGIFAHSKDHPLILHAGDVSDRCFAKCKKNLHECLCCSLHLLSIYPPPENNLFPSRRLHMPPGSRGEKDRCCPMEAPTILLLRVWLIKTEINNRVMLFECPRCWLELTH